MDAQKIIDEIEIEEKNKKKIDWELLREKMRKSKIVKIFERRLKTKWQS